MESEPSGLVNFARVQGIRDGRNAVLARTIIDSPSAQTRLLELGFSDRAVLSAGANELVVAVAEDFGGWGVQARLVGA